MYWRMIERRALTAPDAVSVIADDSRISLGELIAEARARAADFAASGLMPGEVVAISLKDQVLHLVVSLALMRLGCPHVILPTFEPRPYRAALARRCGAVAVVTQSADDGFDGIPAIVVDAARSPRSYADRALPSMPADDAVCMYVASSGSTGQPKVVPITHEQLYLQSKAFHPSAGQEIFYRASGIEFNNAKRHRLYVLLAGGTNLLVDQAQPDIVAICAHHEVTLLGLSQPQIAGLLARAHGRSGVLPPFTQLRMGGATVSRELRRQAAAVLTPNVYVTYGTSETGSVATAGPAVHELDPDIVGSVCPGLDVEIVNDDRRPVATGEVGHIRIRGAAVATHYLADRERSAEAFRDGWFYPGDRGRFIDGPYLCVEGRSDEMMNLATINIFPSEIERTVRAMAGVLDCAAFSMKSPDFGDIPLIAVVRRGEVTERQILVEARNALGIRAPRRVFFVDALPTNSAGKLARNKLNELVQARFLAAGGRE